MRTNVIVLFVLGAFFLLADITYWVWNYLDHGGIEWVGSLAILLVVALAWFPAFYLHRVDKATAGVLPEDNLEANIDDGEPEQGFFSPWSWWPIILAFGAVGSALGLVLGWWLFFIFAALSIVALIGWSFEYNRGHFAR